jgi:hypothetical protein
MRETFESQLKNREKEKGGVDELAIFIDGNDLSAKEANDAYLIAMGIGLGNPDVEDPINPPKKEVYVLAEKMDQLMKEGLAVNRITEFLASIAETEKRLSTAIRDYNKMVESSNLIEREKKVLKSIITDSREGRLMLSCLVKNPRTGAKEEMPLGEIKISIDKEQKWSKEKLALLLMGQLKAVMEMEKPQLIFTA